MEKRTTHECGEVRSVLRRQSISSLLPRFLIQKIRKSENQKMAISLQSQGIENSRSIGSAWSNPKFREKVSGNRLEFETAIHMSSKGTLHFKEARHTDVSALSQTSASLRNPRFLQIITMPTGKECLHWHACIAHVPKNICAYTSVWTQMSVCSCKCV